MKREEFFRQHPVFTGEELAKHLSSLGESAQGLRRLFWPTTGGSAGLFWCGAGYMPSYW